MMDLKIEKLREFSPGDLNDICEATEKTIQDNSQSFNIGFNRVAPISRERLENYWKGVLLVPERELFIGRIDGVITSSIQLLKPNTLDTAKDFVGHIENHFVAPWARGHGLAKDLLQASENEAKNLGLTLIRLAVRVNLEAAIKLYESHGYIKWGTLSQYERFDGKIIGGNFYFKNL